MHEIESEATRTRSYAGGFQDGGTAGAHRQAFAPRTAVRPPADPKEGRHPACRRRGGEGAAGGEEPVGEDLFNWF